MKSNLKKNARNSTRRLSVTRTDDDIRDGIKSDLDAMGTAS